MIANALHAWVLHKRWTGDTSAQVTFFTREQGLINGSCKGGRTPKKQSLLQAFIPLWIVVDARREWHYVRQIEIMSPSLPLVGPALFAGLYVNELLHHMLRPSDAHTLLYDAYTDVLTALLMATDRPKIEAALRRFEEEILTSCGYQLVLTHDIQGIPIDDKKQYTYIAGDGFLLVEKGIAGAHILAFSAGQLDDADVLKSAKWIMRRAIDHALDGKLIKTRNLFVSV